MIAIIDYDVGNVAAVANMLHRIGAECVITSDPDRLAEADRIVLPGNGAFDACMRNLRGTGLIPLIEKRVQEDRVPLLGICVGAQMLGVDSEEGAERGLGWIDMSVRRIPFFQGTPVPHMGWDEVEPVRPHPLLEGLAGDARFYFVHSYYMEPRSRSDVLLMSTYGLSFAAAVARRNICGVQFHPEKSHRFGKALLTNFANWKPACLDPA